MMCDFMHWLTANPASSLFMDSHQTLDRLGTPGARKTRAELMVSRAMIGFQIHCQKKVLKRES